MKKNLLSTTLFFVIGLASAQTIDVSLFVPATPFQDADVGSMAFADIDNDGDQDLLISGKGGPVKTTLYINDGLGNFTVATGTPFVNVFSGTVGFANVNNDSFIDILITGATSGGSKTANLYINNGNGTFSIAPTPFALGSSGDFAFGDIDNDNDKDLIMTGINASDNGFTKLFLNNGSGSFSEVMNTSFEQLKNSSVAFIDIENDGDLDVVLTGKNNSNLISIKLYTNNGTGIYTLNNNSLLDGITNGDIAIADSDNDGDNDILITGEATSGALTKLYANNGTGTFTKVMNTPFTQAFGSATEFADFDNDGDKDILLVGARNGNPSAVAHIYQNQGNNTFVLSNNLIATYLASIAIADIDNDNDLDFIFGGTHFQTPTRNPKMYKNNLNPLSTSNFENSSLITYSPNPTKDFVNFNSKEKIENIIIYNFLGQEVLSKKVTSQEFVIDISNLSNGSYIAKLKSNEKSQSVKLVKF